MLSHLERDGKVESTVELVALLKLCWDEPVRRNLKPLSGNPFTVDAEIVLDPVAREHGEPRTESAPEVDHAPRSNELHDQRDDRLRRASPLLERLALIEPPVVVRLGHGASERT